MNVWDVSGWISSSPVAWFLPIRMAAFAVIFPAEYFWLFFYFVAWKIAFQTGEKAYFPQKIPINWERKKRKKNTERTYNCPELTLAIGLFGSEAFIKDLPAVVLRS
jgi:hypothetical protein